jgi:hypothetical protein
MCSRLLVRKRRTGLTLVQKVPLARRKTQEAKTSHDSEELISTQDLNLMDRWG